MITSRLGVWPPLPIGVYKRHPDGRLPFPLQEPGCRLFSLARQGLYQAILALGLEPEDEVLVPAYHHGAEIEALRQAGVALRFFGAADDLTPRQEEVESLLGPRVRALYLTHVLGLVQDAAYWRSWCDDHGLFLIEDAAQAFLATWHGRPVGSFGHTAIFCLYKTFGFPDGAAVISSPPPPHPASSPKSGLRLLAKRHAAAVAMRVPVPSTTYHRYRSLRARHADPDNEFELGDPASPPSRVTLRLLSRVIDPDAAAQRFSNYSYLLETLGALVPSPFARPPEGSAPFAFPIRSENPPELAARLARKGVSSMEFWKNPHPLLDVSRYPFERTLRATTLILPVHQELSGADLDRIVGGVLAEA